MPTYFQRPENALKRANEFIDVGKKQRALDALYDVIKSKKHRTWQKIHEPIMEKYLALCVELRKSHIAKEGLYQYKNICQQVNIKSLEDVVRKYILLAEKKTEEARKASHQAVVDVDDLEMPDTPESLLLKAVSGEDTQDRTDRAILTPWVKFLWESYRQCLDLLRNNSRVERLYQDIAQQAFKFCLNYTRKTEFRKLCDNLRTHLGHIHKHQHQQTAINLNNPDSQAMHLETRLVQLDSAINMELWQEAFKAVEDIHGLIGLSKKSPKPSLMANYYQKLGLVFWKSGNTLFHACTLHRLYQLSREQRKNMSQEELQKMASKVLCATLAIPIPPSRNPIDQLLEMDETTMDKKRRLSTLLMLQTPPTRQGLVKDLIKYNVIQHVHPELQNLYRWLEVEFHPLRLNQRVVSPIEFISKNDDLSPYVEALESIVITRVLKQVSQVYQTIEFSRLAGLVPFASKFRLERIIVEASKTLELQVRIDHRSKSLSFGTDLMVAQKEDVPEGPYIQSMPSEHIRNQLTFIAQALHKAINTIQPKDQKVQRDELKGQIANSYRMTSRKEHQRILQRRQIIEDRKEQLEHLNDQREREEMEQAEEQKKKAYEAEMARLDREAKERERQRKIEEHKEIQKKHAMERIEQLKKTDIGAKVLQNLDEEDFANLDVDDIMAKQVEQLEKEKKELMERLKNQEKKIDYFARAKRLEEIPLLEEQYEKEKVINRDFWEQQEAERIENLKKDRELALQTRDRLSCMRGDKDEFLSRLKNQRKEQFKEKSAQFEKQLAEARRERLKERKIKRKEDRRIKWITEKEEAEQKAKDEALKKEREEKERIEKEKLEAEKKEYAEKLLKLQEQAERQKQRDREIEEREEKRREEEKKQYLDRLREERDGRGPERDSRGPPPSRDGEERRTAWRPAVREGGWREREKQRSDSWKKDPTSPSRRDEDDDGDGGPPRDEKDGYRDRGPPERDGWRDRGAPPEERDTWRDRGPPKEDRDLRGPPRDDRRGPPKDDRDGWRDRGPPRDDRESRGPGDRWGDRGPSRDERGPSRDEDGWRRGAPRDDRDSRDDDRWRRGPPRDDRDSRGPPRDDRDSRGPPKDEWRRGGDRGPPRDDRGPSREEGGGWRDRERSNRDDDRGGWRRDRDSRGPPSRDDRGLPPRDDRGPPSRDDRGSGPWRGSRGGDSEGGNRWGPPSRGGDSWRDRASDRGEKDFRSRDDRGPPPPRDERRGPPPSDRGGDTWRRGGGTSQRSEGGEEDDGWTTVRY